jgi:GGDEF domain-containing protein
MLISILKSGSEMARLEKFKNVALECYGLAIASTQQNVIEVDREQASVFRAELQALLDQLDEATTPEQVRKIQDCFREDLRKYRESTHEQIRQLRKEMDAALSAFDAFAGDTAARGDDHEKELKGALKNLEAAAFSGRFEEIRAAIRAASADILSSFEQMRAQNQLAVAQLKDEIRLLHQRIQGGRRLAAPAPETWNRQEIDHRIDEMLKQNTSFCLVLIVLKNLKPLTSRYSGAAVEDALQALQARLRDALGDASVLGRWTANQFVAILSVSPSSAVAASRDAARKLAEPYSFTHNGSPSTLVFQIAAGVVDHQAGSDVLKFQPKLASLSAALGGGPL